MYPAEALPPVTPAGPGLHAGVAMRLSYARGSAGAARHAVKERFGDVLGQETLDDALLVVSELVTNAVRHGTGDIELRVAFDGHRLTGVVRDEGQHFPQPAGAHAPGQIGGSGLHMVRRIAESWGLRDGCSQVWFEIASRRLD